MAVHHAILRIVKWSSLRKPPMLPVIRNGGEDTYQGVDADTTGHKYNLAECRNVNTGRRPDKAASNADLNFSIHDGRDRLPEPSCWWII
ncbi:hypothetical protein N0V85_004413 [Neurospora sp. IMI 360204]|nr:hypothetical protein N0V85_004413 [Neurospora sp. IMI 360204]